MVWEALYKSKLEKVKKIDRFEDENFENFVKCVKDTDEMEIIRTC